jgi:N-acetylmuramoyl-L-alanine amidase-like protein
MISLSRRKILSSLPSAAAGMLLAQCADSEPAATNPLPQTGTGAGPVVSSYHGALPWSTVFVGEDRFRRLCTEAQQGNWATLPLGQRTVTVGKALLGTRYENYTLEIDDHIESPSVNLYGLDCWTFYEVSLAFARMIRSTPAPWTGEALLRYVELERYRDGRCDGTYLSRMHHLEEVFYNNEKRGLGRNLTQELGGVPIHREIREMQIAWKHYRYLSHNSDLRRGIAEVEARVSDLPVRYIPEGRVAGIEDEIHDGDVLAIVSKDATGYTSHVGLALRNGSTCHLMHATSSYDKGRCCMIDARISHYLADKRQDMGLIVFRPNEVG